MCSSVNVRAQTSRHLVLVMCVSLSHAAMHSGIFLPVAPPVIDEPPLVAMTSPSVPTIAAVGASIAAVTGAWGTAPLVEVFGNIKFATLRIEDPIVVVVALAVVSGALTAGVANSKPLAPRSCDPLEEMEVMSVVVGGLSAGVATSCAPVLN
jgi:hypothetical protein